MPKILSYLKNRINWKRLYAFPFVFICIFLICAYQYVDRRFGKMTGAEFLFFINTPMEGADKRLVHIFINKCVINPLIYALLICYAPEILRLPTLLLNQSVRLYSFYVAAYRKLCRWYNPLLICGALIISVFYLSKFSFLKEVYDMTKAPYTTFYEDNFTEPNPQSVLLEPQKNLVILSVESLEKTFEDEEFFGKSLLPHLQELEKEGVQFSDYMNGWRTTYTAASVMALFAGVPADMIGMYMINVFAEDFDLLKGYYSLGNILSDNGYQTYAVQGSSKNFSGLGHFFETHGIQKIVDNKAIKENYAVARPEGDWGYDDEDVLNVVKQIISGRNSDKPYFMIIQTIDSHDNYKPKIKQHGIFKNPYHNVIYNTQLQIYNFVQWLKTQPDYEDTVVLIVGDHLRMGSNFSMPEKRRIYNLFLNAPTPENTQRIFSQIDMFPSILEAIGAKIPHHHLGLGVSVFSNSPTLLEQYPDDLAEKLSGRSKLSEKLWKI